MFSFLEKLDSPGGNWSSLSVPEMDKLAVIGWFYMHLTHINKNQSSKDIGDFKQ